MAMNLETIIERLLTLFKLPTDFKWREHQKNVMEKIYNGEDILAVLPTGYGKSKIFQSAQFIVAAKEGDLCLFYHNYIN